MRHFWITGMLSLVVFACAPASKITQEDLDSVNAKLEYKEQEMAALQKENEELRREIEILKRAAYGNEPQAIEQHNQEEMRRMKEGQVRLHQRMEKIAAENKELRKKLQEAEGQRNSEKLPE